MNLPCSLVSASISTNSDTAVAAVAAQPGKSFGPWYLFNPEGSAAGQWSDGNFADAGNIFAFPAGPCAVQIASAGSVNNGIKIRRIAGQADVSGLRIILT